MPKKGKRGFGFYHVKKGTARRRLKLPNSVTDDSLTSSCDDEPISDPPCAAASISDSDSNSETSSVFEAAFSIGESIFSDNAAEDSSSGQEDTVITFPTAPLHESEDADTVLAETLKTLSAIMPMHWRVIQDREGFHMLYFSRGKVNLQVQREVYASFDALMKIFVHKKEIVGSLRDELMKHFEWVPLTSMSIKVFADSVIKVVSAVKRHEICSGVDDIALQSLWAFDSSGKFDDNPYNESRYDKTFRSHDCCLLIPIKKWRCADCKKAFDRQRKIIHFALKEEFDPKTRNDYLSANQSKSKLKSLHDDLKRTREKVNYYKNQVTELMNKEAVTVDDDFGEHLTEILRHSNLTPIQQLFIQQQCKSANCKSSKGMRWHPILLRVALLIKSTSTAAYRALKASGVISLPSERTLFDYEHAVPREDGVFYQKLEELGEKAQKFKVEHNKFFNLLVDEIHLNRKLVYRKSDGQLIGYTKLDEAEIEMKDLAESIKNGVKSEAEPEVATKILAYMIRGCTNSVKEVVAAFTTGCLTKEQLFMKTWQVIRACEGVQVKILAIVCDGCSVNRAFLICIRLLLKLSMV